MNTNTAHKTETIAGRKVANWQRPANMPRTAVQIDGVWCRNHQAAMKIMRAR